MKIKFHLFIILFLFIFVGCTNGNEEITIEGPTEIFEYQTVLYQATGLKNDSDQNIIWSSSNEEVALVSSSGELTGLAAGIIRLFAKLESNPKISSYIDITIKPLIIEQMDISGDTTIVVNETEQLSVIAVPSYAPNLYTWGSSNESIVSVSDSGLIEGLSIGSATITATSLVNESFHTEILISVVRAPLQTIEILGNDEVSIGYTISLSAVENQEEVNELVTWSVSDETKATVNEQGVLFGLQEGSVIVTAKAKGDENVIATKLINVVFRPYVYYHTKILMIDYTNKNIELLNVSATKYDSQTTITQHVNGTTKSLSINDLYLGMENVYVKIDTEANVISSIVVDGEIGFSNIRVGIRKSINDISIDSTLYHDSLSFRILENMNLQTFDGQEIIAISEASNLTFTYVNGKIEVKNGENVILTTEKRVILESLGENENVQFMSISRSNGQPYYHGSMEVAIKNNRLLVVNDVDLEKYLYKVLPSEMPSSFGLEALKAQAIAARTYAYMDVLNKATLSFGYSVDDSVKSQVYNNASPNDISKQAVNGTKSQIMTYNNNPISAFYYSTSSGLTASGHEVWIQSQVGQVTPYLIGQNLTQDENGDPLLFDYQDELSMLTFFKTIKMTTPDSALSSYHRWKVAFTKSQLTNTINTNLRLTYNATPQSVLTKNGTNWLSQVIPSSIGEVTNIYVGERGTSGVVVSLIIETTTGIYKIVNQYNIRFTVRPKDAGSTVYRYSAKGTQTTYGTSPSKNDSILLSGFFAIEIVDDYVTFYGGGNGHGVGMSQYGAYGLANAGKDYVEILKTYYSNIAFTDIGFK